MKTKLLPLMVLLVAAPFAVKSQSPAEAFLLKADFVSREAEGAFTATGRVEVQTKASGYRFTGERIVGQSDGTITLSGNVEIHAADGSRITVRELVLDTRDKRVFWLSRTNGTIHRADEPERLPGASFVEPFKGEMPKTETDIRRARPLAPPNPILRH